MNSNNFVVLLYVLLLSSCASPGGNWGANVTLSPGWEKVKLSARRAVKDPHTWVPLVSAAAFGIDDFDQQAADWATRRTPVFGDREDAEDASHLLQDLSKINHLITAVAAPSGRGRSGLKNKVRGLVSGIAVLGINDGITNSIKSVTDRKRPDEDSDADEDNSFPSWHMSSASISARLASRNIEYMNLTPNQKKFWRISSHTVAGFTGWARIEGGRHYPSDVLAGYALGNFLGRFLNDAFIDPGFQNRLSIGVNVNGRNEGLLTVAYRW
jgi:hypothetical protein